MKLYKDVKFTQPESFETVLIAWGKTKIVNRATLDITDGGSTVRVTIDAQGRGCKIKQEMLDEMCSPNANLFASASRCGRISSAAVTVRIVPVN